MNPKTALSKVRRLAPALGLACWTILSVKAAPAPPVLSVPPTETTLHVAVPLSPGPMIDPSQRMQLVEARPGSPPLASSIFPVLEPDGTLSATAQLLVVSIPPRLGATDVRHFRLVQDPGSATTSEQAFRWQDIDAKSLGLWEGLQPVLVYNHGMQTREGVPADRARSTYIHPLYGLDGEVLTDDFPIDHYHHRGLFWAWPHIRIDGTNYSTWDLRGIEQRFERWLERRSGSAAATLTVENGWMVGPKKVMQERARFTIYPKVADSRMMDVELTWIPLDKPVTLVGAEDKSYGGLTLRFAPRTNTVITTPLGIGAEDLAVTKLPWADLTARFSDARGPSGAAIFIHPQHPDYPPTWLTRHYGVLCVGWPGVSAMTFQPGQFIRCQYRVWIHRGSPDVSEFSRIDQTFHSLQKVRWERQAP